MCATVNRVDHYGFHPTILFSVEHAYINITDRRYSFLRASRSCISHRRGIYLPSAMSSVYVIPGRDQGYTTICSQMSSSCTPYTSEAQPPSELYMQISDLPAHKDLDPAYHTDQISSRPQRSSASITCRSEIYNCPQRSRSCISYRSDLYKGIPGI